jgi:ribosomal protein S18 acetylase RimI-like enzyme
MSHFEIVSLSPQYQEEFKNFLLRLDNKTLRNYTRFGTFIDEEAAEKIAARMTKIEPEKELGFILIDKTNGRIAAYAHLEFFAKKGKEHVARMGIVVSPEYQNMGLGKILMKHIIGKAKEIGLTKIWLSVYLDNKVALHFYKSFGFIIEGIFHKEEREGKKFRDVVSMALFLDGSITQEKAIKKYLKVCRSVP